MQLKRKAREGADADVGVVLGAAGASESEGEDEEDAVHASASGRQDPASDEDDAVYVGGLSSSDEEEAEPQQKGKPGHAAYFGMQMRTSHADAGNEYKGLSLAEQEALALRMIQR